VKKAKDLFRDTEIQLDFAYLGRDFREFAERPVTYYWKRNIKGRIIASLYMSIKQKKPILSFRVLKENVFSNELKTEFEQSFLQEFYDVYIKQLNENALTGKEIFMCVELLDGKLIKHLITL
jgi:hypothetical protein